MSVIRTGHRGSCLAAPLAAAGLVLVAACSSPAAGTDTATQSTSGATSAAAAPSGDMQAFTSCLAENGVTLPNAGTGGDPPEGGARPSGAPHAPGTPPSGAAGATPAAPPGVDQQTWDAAMQACGDLAPANFGKGG
jgi:hypothetical protein